MDITDKKNAKNSEVKEKIYFSKGVLKSATQKAIRRGEVEKAVRCTKSFLELDELDCLRRSMIWPAEDVLLHPQYDELAKLTYKLSQKGSVPLTDKEKTKVLTIVGDFARCEYRDLDVDNPDDPGEAYQMKSITGREVDLVNALLFRARAGGSRYDVPMLNQMARVWNKRFSEKTWDVEKLKSYYTGKVIEWKSVAYAQREDILPESIDMHTDPWIMGKLLQKPDVKDLLHKLIPINDRDWANDGWADVNIIEQVMWCCRSSINLKLNIWMKPPRTVSYLEADHIPERLWPAFEELYRRIEPDLDEIAKLKLDRQAEKM